MKLSARVYQVIPEGTHVFKIDAIEYNEEFGKMSVSMHIKSGLRHVERYSLLDRENQSNDKALNAFSYFARCALNDFEVDDIDPQSLVGHYIKAEVTHDDVTNNDGETRTYARLGKKSVATGFEDEVTSAENENAPTGNVDLDSVLGGL